MTKKDVDLMSGLGKENTVFGILEGAKGYHELREFVVIYDGVEVKVGDLLDRVKKDFEVLDKEVLEIKKSLGIMIKDYKELKKELRSNGMVK